MCRATSLAAGTLPDFLYTRDIVPGETVDLTGDVNNSDNGADEYDSCSSVEEEEIDDDESQSVATLDREANFLLGRVSACGRAVRFNSRLMFS